MAVRDFLKRISAWTRKPGATDEVPAGTPPHVTPRPSWSDARGTPTYDADFLTVWHKNPDFLQDQKFMAAYKAGMNSGHKIARPAGSSDDIHIEWRIHICCWAAWHAKQLPGDFVECGTNTGIMSLAVANYIDFNSTGKTFFSLRYISGYSGRPDHTLRTVAGPCTGE
jgi:O-methyltransferase